MQIQIQTLSYSETSLKDNRRYLILSNVLHFLDNFRLFVASVEVGHITRIQNHTDVFHESFVLDLTVGEQEHCLTTISTSLQ